VTPERDHSAMERLARAKNLFEFLARAQQLKSSPPRTTEAYARDGQVLWLADLPAHQAVSTSHRGGDPGPEAPLFTVDRVARIDPPGLDDMLRAWVTATVDDPVSVPALREQLPAGRVPELEPRVTQDGPEEVVRVEDHPLISEAFTAWLEMWQAWAEIEVEDRPVRELYGELFSTYVKASGHPEELELILGVGCLAWSPEGHQPVRRHMLTCPAGIHFDDDTGRLTVTREAGLDPIAVELDMLDPHLIRNPQHINEIKTAAKQFDAHPLHHDEVGALARRLVHTLDPNGAYLDQDTRPNISTQASAAYAPALILRKRSQQGLVEIFQTIVAQLSEADEVPAGLLPLVDPDRQPTVEHDTTPGAIVSVDDEAFLPLPVNERQLKILKAVDSRGQTVVQGPPGTGKTHTAAALLSHLLAQGKRVLVAAHTDRALREVRDKLPPAIKPLSVAVVGSSRSDMSDLKVAVEHIAATASEHDPEAAARDIAKSLSTIDDLRRQRAATYRRLLDAREHEVTRHQRGPYEGSLAAIAQRYQDDAPEHSWITDFVDIDAESHPPLAALELTEWRNLLRDEELLADEDDAGQRLVELDSLPQPHEFARLCDDERDADAGSRAHAQLASHEAFESVRVLDPAVREHLQQRMRALADEALALEQRREAWMNEALFEIRADRAATWDNRARQIKDLISQAIPLVQTVGPLVQVEIAPTPVGVPELMALAQNLQAHLQGGAVIKTSGGGQPKIGMLSPKPVKEAAPLFEQTRVDGLPPVTANQVATVITFAEASRVLDALDRAWPANVTIPAEDTLQERLQWHITELQQLTRVLNLGEGLAAEESRLDDLGLKRPDWTNLETVRTYASLVDAAAAQDAWARANQPIAALEADLTAATRWADAGASLHQLHLAVRSRDHDEYARGYARLTRLHHVRTLIGRREELAAKLDAVPDLRNAVRQDPEATDWDTWLPGFERAWTWAATGAWILDQDTTDINALQAQIGVYDGRIRREVETLAATRAWSHAVAPDRITGQARADLAQYAFLVRRLGKGTGKYAAQQRAEIRKAMDRCRPAVPVWIMPIYRIAEQLAIHENMFDVVIVDEASQAGLEATLLQYLAPKIVVIGDDKQVSPAAVGIDQQQLRDLANQYLADDRYKASWQDPKRSLFDEALMRYGGHITLVEHRRCVPEIIGFSNRIAYEPDGVRLVPVRQYGADRLDPIKVVHVEDGYERGSTAKVNPAEVDAIVDQIEKCLADPRYDGLTFGVISLLGTAQAKAIESQLLERIPPEEWAARDLRCGDAADFQGSERDIMFLSMVAAPSAERRLGALTAELYVQRYNVAASRAKDQLWLFHTVRLDDLGNPEDMRFALLDYCYGVVNRTNVDDDRVQATAVPDDVRVEPFDSLFEQRVFNRLYDRGYTVIPQYQAEGYNLDLVVVGSQARLAIECDGDTWHGPDAYEADLARQRDLERCGWQFFRIRESAFYVDQAGALEDLWRTLDELAIHPSGWLGEDLADDDLEGDDEIYEDRPVMNDWSRQGAQGGDYEAATPHELVQSTPKDPSQNPPPPTVAPAASPGWEPEDAHPMQPSVAALAGHPVAVTEVDDVPVELDDVADHEAPSERLDAYVEFTGAVAPPVNASRQELLDGLTAIVAVEGPVVGHRLHTAYVRAAGGQRVGKAVAKILNSAISTAVRQGTLVADNPLGEAGVKPRTYRLPGQPEMRPRELGPRAFEQIPPSDLAAMITQAADAHGWTNSETLYRVVLGRLGLHRLTPNVEGRLVQALRLALSEQQGTAG
jgi:very-short-patch-repair endonuclease